MDKATQATLAAAIRLHDSAKAIELAIAEMNATQAKHDANIKRILGLVKAQSSAFSASERAALSSLSGRHTVQQRTLEKQRQKLIRAREAFEQKNNAFSEIVDTYLNRLVMMDTTARDHQKLETAAYRVIERMILDAWPGRNPERDTEDYFEKPESSHSYIALDIPRFLKLLIQLDSALSLDPDYAVAAGRYRPVSFLEVGCGQGRNIIIARNSKLLLVEKFAGFDLNPIMVEGGRQNLGLAENLFVADALDFDYGTFDVVFSYRPISDANLQVQLEERMVRTMKPGAYLMAPYAYDLTLYPELSRLDPETEIWKKEK